MSANIIDGKEVARKLRERISSAVKKIEQEYNKIPGLAVVLVGNDPASEVYVRNKGIQTKEVGMTSYEFKLPEDTPEKELLEKGKISKKNALIFNQDLPSDKSNYHLSTLNHHHIIEAFDRFLANKKYEERINNLRKKHSLDNI